MFKKIRRRFCSWRAFTLIEMMVSISIFSIIMLLISSSYIALLSANRKERLSTDAINNLSTAIDSIARDIRTGSCSNSTGANVCPATGAYNSFTFVDSDGCKVEYSLNANKEIVHKVFAFGSTCKASDDVITDSSAVSVTAFTFDTYVLQATNTNVNNTAEQVWTVIRVTGVTPKMPNGVVNTFHIETGATMRGISII